MQLTMFQRHVEEWGNCTRCSLSEGRTKVVLGKGKIPCDILLTGEAPGESENLVGTPFCGPSGRLLDNIVETALRGHQFRVAYTNIVCCIPRGEDGDKIAQPPSECIEACAPRLKQFVMIANPRLIVCVGKMAKDWLEPGYKHSITFHKEIPQVDITHPAAILRASLAAQGLMRERAIVRIQDAVEEFLNQRRSG